MQSSQVSFCEMEIPMPLLTELGKFWCTRYYKHVAPTALEIWTTGCLCTAAQSGFSMIPRINYKADAALQNR